VVLCLPVHRPSGIVAVSQHRPVEPFALAAEEFNRQAGRSDGLLIATSLLAGLNVLRDAFYARVHDDVEKLVGMDSMLMPVSEEKTERLTKREIALYEIAESAACVRKLALAPAPNDWYLSWLTELWIGQLQKESRSMARLAGYVGKSSSDRRLWFADLVSRALPEATRAPLVLFRLMPLAVGVATALAFRETDKAAHLRERQAEELPAIADCSACHGLLLANGQQCRECGSPLWSFKWLTATD
jgi:hypothetical protein